MRFLADENFPAAARSALIAAGHDVSWVGAVAPGVSDPDVLALAGHEGRILLTFDKDFGELTKSWAFPPGCGAILFRIPAPSPGSVVESLAAPVLARDDWAGHISVIEPGRIRMRVINQR